MELRATLTSTYYRVVTPIKNWGRQDELIKSQTWTSEAFFLAKVQEQDLRHKKCRGTTYNLEPNLKENPGGLRDIQTIIWVAKKHFKSQLLSDLITDGYLTYEEHQELLECLLNL